MQAEPKHLNYLTEGHKNEIVSPVKKFDLDKTKKMVMPSLTLLKQPVSAR
jgi:hypothetical protein